MIIGIGNPLRGDDGVGLVVAEMLKAMHLEGVVITEENGDVSALMNTWVDADEIFLIDAVVSGAKAGMIYRFDASRQPLPKEIFASVSTHAFCLADSIELARTLNRLPGKVIVYGIEGVDFSMHSGLSPDVERASREVVECILVDLEAAAVSES